ncbi:MAG: cache domain-containing protein [Desulfobacterales bacterium]|nr:cache domain-containing protein [Desulfobacterales bacterium]
MPRISHMVVTVEQAVYHALSRTALDGLPFGDIEKDFFVKLLKKPGKLYFTDVIGFCVMGNHFHLLVRMLPYTDFTDRDIKERYIRYYGNDTNFSNGQIPYYRSKWSSLIYYWNNPETKKEEKKLGYVEAIPGTTLYIGSGIYMH